MVTAYTQEQLQAIQNDPALLNDALQKLAKEKRRLKDYDGEIDLVLYVGAGFTIGGCILALSTFVVLPVLIVFCSLCFAGLVCCLVAGIMHAYLQSEIKLFREVEAKLLEIEKLVKANTPELSPSLGTVAQPAEQSPVMEPVAELITNVQQQPCDMSSEEPQLNTQSLHQLNR